MRCRSSGRFVGFASVALLLALAGGCGGDGGVASADQARLAYVGLDLSIDKAIDLGLQGYRAASSAHIPDQTGSGKVKGTLTVGGKVDQGASNNKEMTLTVTMAEYTDSEDPLLTYSTAAPVPALGLSLKKIPSGTLSGTFQGRLNLTGALQGEVTLSLGMTGQLEPDPADASKPRRKPGTTRITGSATSPFGTYQVDVTR